LVSSNKCEADKSAANDGFCWPPSLVVLDCYETSLTSHDLVQLARQCGPHLRELAFDIADYGTGHIAFTNAVNQLLGSLIRFF
jgi:hypothetical protein